MTAVAHEASETVPGPGPDDGHGTSAAVSDGPARDFAVTEASTGAALNA